MTEDQTKLIRGFDNIIQVLYKEDRNTFNRVVPYVFSVKPEDIRRYDYTVQGENWHVWDTPAWKITGNDSKDYNEFFSKTDGFVCKFGSHVKDDPYYCPLGPSILDLEISTNQCTPVGRCNCRFCYKANNAGPGKNMTFDTFKAVIGRFPKNLGQIAFGITSLHANKDFPAMVKACRNEFGIIPNVTTSGADLTDDMIELIVDNMGACAVSCYETDPSLCYRSIKRIWDFANEKRGRKFHINMHILFSKMTFDFVMKTLTDIKDGKVPGLKSVVLLRLKNVGNAKNLDPSIPADMYRKVIDFCLANNISFGFDSCGAKSVVKVLHEMGKDNLIQCCESCESSSHSAYINVDGYYTSCSFVERRPDVIKPVNVLDYKSFTDVWYLPEVIRIREYTRDCADSCPWYKLD